MSRCLLQLTLDSCKNNYFWVATLHNLVNLDKMKGKLLLVIISNIMNNLDVAMCHLMDDCLGATCEIKVSACCSCKYSHNNMFNYVYMVDVHKFYNRKINPLFASSGCWRLLLGIFLITNVTYI